MERDPRKIIRDVSGFIPPLVVLIVYANSLFNGFALDDHDVILNNPLFNGDFWSIFSAIDTTGEGLLLPLYRPVTYLTFWLERSLHGFDPFWVRAVNVALHTVNTALVYRMVRTLSGEESLTPLIAALLFAVHPVNTESVDFNAGGRNTMLALLFSLTAWLLHDRAINSGRWFTAWGGAFSFLLAIFSKESGAMIAPFILLQEIQTVRRSGERRLAHAILRLFPYLLAAAAYLLLRWNALSRYGIQTSIVPGVGTGLLETMYVIDPLPTRILHNLYIIPRYLWTILCPTHLAPRHVIPDDLNLLALPLFVTWGAIVAAVSWTLLRARRTPVLFGLLWFLTFWFPVSGLFVIPVPLAERYLYAPAVGCWIMAGHLTERLLVSPKLRTPVTVLLIVLLFLLAGLTIRRNLDWRGNVTLHDRFASQFPDNIHAVIGLGVSLYDRNHPGDRERAEEIFRRVLSTDPTAPKVSTLLGNIMLDRGEYEDALRLYDQALSIDPSDVQALVNRGITHEKLGRVQEALADYRRFLSRTDSWRLPAGREHAERRVRVLDPVE